METNAKQQSRRSRSVADLRKYSDIDSTREAGDAIMWPVICIQALLYVRNITVRTLSIITSIQQVYNTTDGTKLQEKQRADK